MNIVSNSNRLRAINVFCVHQVSTIQLKSNFISRQIEYTNMHIYDTLFKSRLLSRLHDMAL